MSRPLFGKGVLVWIDLLGGVTSASAYPTRGYLRSWIGTNGGPAYFAFWVTTIRVWCMDGGVCGDGERGVG
jgi:hypothetical protein